MVLTLELKRRLYKNHCTRIHKAPIQFEVLTNAVIDISMQTCDSLSDMML